MATKQLVRKKLGSWLYASGQRVANTIDRDGILYQLNLRCRFTITNGATGPVGPLAATLARIIQRLEIQLNGKDTIINATGEQLVCRALYENGALPYGMDATVVLTNSAVTNYDIVIPVMLFLPHSVNPRDTGLECRTLQQVNVAVTFANSNCSDFFTTTNSAALSNVQLDITGEYIINAPIKNVGDADYFVRVLDYVIQPVTGTNSQLGVQMDRGPQFYRSFHILAQQNNINVDTIVNNLKMQAGSFVFYDMPGVVSRAELLSDFGIFPASGAGILLTGNYRIDMSKFGSLDTAINVDPAALLVDLYHYYDVTYTSGTTNLIISREAIRKPNIS